MIGGGPFVIQGVSEGDPDLVGKGSTQLIESVRSPCIEVQPDNGSRLNPAKRSSAVRVIGCAARPLHALYGRDISRPYNENQLEIIDRGVCVI